MSAMDPQDESPRPSLAELQAALDRSLADVAAGRTVPMETVLAELDASIARMERRRAAKATDAA
jgi:hypothetical protein